MWNRHCNVDVYAVAYTTRTIPPRPMLKMLIGAPPSAGKVCGTYIEGGIEGGIVTVGLYVSWAVSG